MQPGGWKARVRARDTRVPMDGWGLAWPSSTAPQGALFCAGLQEVPLPGCGGDPLRFMEAAAAVANARAMGSLGVGVVAHPSVQVRGVRGGRGRRGAAWHK